MAKGRKVYVEGRLQTRKWTGQDNLERITTEIVISDMIILDSRMQAGSKPVEAAEVPENLDEVLPPVEDQTTTKPAVSDAATPTGNDSSGTTKTPKAKVKKDDEAKAEEVKEAEADDDIPF